VTNSVKGGMLRSGVSVSEEGGEGKSDCVAGPRASRIGNGTKGRGSSTNSLRCRRGKEGGEVPKEEKTFECKRQGKARGVRNRRGNVFPRPGGVHGQSREGQGRGGRGSGIASG